MSLLDLTLSTAHPVMSLAGHLLAAAGDQGNGLPDSDPMAPPGVLEPFQRVIGVVKWVALGVCVIALIIWAAMVAWSSHRGRGEDLAGGFGRVLLGVVVIGGAASILSFIAG